MGANKKKYVLDASVVLKWVLFEDEDLEKAMVFRDGFNKNEYQLVVPGHFFSEICNTLGRKNSDAAKSFLSILRMGKAVECRLTLELADRAFGLTRKYKKISFYDAFYHAIALELGCDFVTADRKYYNVVKEEGSIQLLSAFTG